MAETTPEGIKKLLAIEEKPFYGSIGPNTEGLAPEPGSDVYWRDVPSPFGGNEIWTFDDVRLAKTAWNIDNKVLATRAEAQAYFPRYRELNPINTWKDDFKDAVKGIATVVGVVGGAAALGSQFAPAVAAEGALPLAPTTAIASEYPVAELAAYDAALAEGAAAGVGYVPIASGAETVISGGGIFSGVSSGLKSTVETLGIASLFKSALSGVSEGFSSLIEKETQGLFDGSQGQGGGSVSVTTAGTASEKMSMLPWILIALTIVGAFILTRKGRKK